MIAKNTYLEKLGILSELIAFAKVDGLVASEYDFLLEVATDFEIDIVVFDSLFEVEVDRVKPKTILDRIKHFQILIKLMNVDKKRSILEINKLHKIGVNMGLSPAGIEQVLTLMHKYPNNEVPLHIIEKAFKVHYN